MNDRITGNMFIPLTLLLFKVWENPRKVGSVGKLQLAAGFSSIPTLLIA